MNPARKAGNTFFTACIWFSCMLAIFLKTPTVENFRLWHGPRQTIIISKVSFHLKITYTVLNAAPCPANPDKRKITGTLFGSVAQLTDRLGRGSRCLMHPRKDLQLQLADVRPDTNPPGDQAGEAAATLFLMTIRGAQKSHHG